jgi:hypothetical protein
MKLPRRWARDSPQSLGFVQLTGAGAPAAPNPASLGRSRGDCPATTQREAVTR